MLLPYFRDSDTSLLNLTNRFNTKLNISDTLNMLSNYLRRADTTLMLLPYLRKADTTNMLSPYFRDADTTSLNLTSRFAAKQNILNGTGFVKASGTNITYDNSSYLRTGLADSTYLKLTGGTLTGALSGTTGTFTTRLGVGSSASINPTIFSSGSGDQEIHFTHSDNIPGRKVSLRLTNNSNSLYTYGGLIYAIQGDGFNQYNRMTLGINTTEILHLTRFSRVGIMNDSPSYTLDVSGTLGVTGAATLSSTLAVQGDITEAGNNLLTSADTNNMLLPYMRDADTTQLNLTSRFSAKQNNITLTTTGTSGLATFNGTTLNIPNYTASGGTGTVTSVGLTAPSIFNVGGSPVTTSGTLALTYSGTALPLLNGGTGATTADGALTNLGATAQGKLLFGLQNTVTDKFIKVNTNNTITLLDAADTRSAIGAGVGTVTSVTATSPMISSGGTTPNLSMPEAATNVSGYVSHLGDQYFTGNKFFWGNTTMLGITFFKDYTYQATRLAGLSLTDRFATVTLGSGLSLSGGVLSATSGGVTSVTASTPLSSTGGATPNITIANASSSASGVVTTGTQVFAGEKEFEGRIKTTALERVIVNSTGTSISLGTGVTWLNIHQDATVTVTLPSAASYRGREIIIKQTGSGVVFSASLNIIGFTTAFNGSTQTAIINPAIWRFATLVSDGTNWIIMQRDN
jgi:hypothetical protein